MRNVDWSVVCILVALAGLIGVLLKEVILEVLHADDEEEVEQ